MQSITYGDVSFKSMIQIIKKYIQSDQSRKYEIAIGTDSQNFDITKVVVVVAIWRVGNGGIFFYDIKRVNKISNLRQKIFYETSLSIELAQRLSEKFNEEDFKCDISIHVDVGDDGLTSKMIPEIVGWVKSCGFTCNVKPYSYAASSIANKYSK
ncbi:ribonuclease H-like YkuK family protein [Clostridium thailandense]|uniref:Ribonuclease H-like YkuK family protein n=1 Tax=Clostridium thailandense TaxID=2794346 RepID=A0A949TTS3_9CLOT|nr:ribonuclease H-like YkuK family protein [Clostridium thailandense]MBV7276347.1 ribonuclease H-like YkuK family protein [Clostridium thailandense]